MQPDQQSIDRFYNGKCNPEEAKLVMDWLLENESSSALAKDWSDAASRGEYPAAYPEEMLAFIKANTSLNTSINRHNDTGQYSDIDRHNDPDRQEPVHQRRPGLLASISTMRMRRIPWKKMAVAASVFLAAGLALLWHNGGGQGKDKNEAAAIVAGKKDPIATPARLIAVNAPSGKQSVVRLADGSTVVLEPGAILRYDPAAYNQKERTLLLEGQAVFTAAAEKDKPFSVHANGYTTTALGTSFLVATRSTDGIRVRLFSGKVVVRQVSPLHTTLNAHTTLNDVYLQPGEELAYDQQMHQLLVSRFEPSSGKLRPAVNKRTDMRVAGDTLVFDNAPLADVLDLLHKRYHVTIQYDRKILSDANFTGQVLPGDAIELILKTVTRINNLTLIAADDGFIIR